MRYFISMTYILSFTIFWQISTKHVSKEGKLFYVSEPTLKLDQVTSKEQCASHSGSLLHADALTSGSGSYVTGVQLQEIKKFKLTENTSYWLDGSAPYLTNSCLLFYNESTVMAAGCTQKHGFICEIDLGFTSSISMTELSHSTSRSTPKTTSAVESSKAKLDLTIMSSFSSYHTPRTSLLDSSLYTATASLKNVPFIASALQLSSTFAPTNSNISQTKGTTMSFSNLHENTPTGSHHGPTQGILHTTAGKQIINHQYCSLYCDRYLSSLTVADLIKLLTNVSVSDTIYNSKLNESPLLNAKETGRAKRKLTSAPDSRYSSRAIGGLAVIIITFVPVTFIVMDLPKFLKHLKCCRSK